MTSLFPFHPLTFTSAAAAVVIATETNFCDKGF